MSKHLEKDTVERLKIFKLRVKDAKSVSELCLVEIAGALMILADKIGKRFL